MAATLPPGIGNDQQAEQATAFMREQPWYRQQMAEWGANPDNPGGELANSQKDQLLKMARDHGIGISDRYEIGDNGEIREGGHKLRNALIGAGIAGAMFIPGVGPAVLHGLTAAGHGIASGVGALGSGLSSGASALGGAGGVIGAGSKIAGLLGAGKDTVESLGAQNAAEANQLANNRIAGARVDQGGPAADQTAFRNAMRAGLVARMDPNAAPLNLNGHVLPSLTSPENVDYAKSMQARLAARQTAGQTPTEFGVPDPTQAEMEAGNKAKTYGTTGNIIDTGSKIANIFGLFSKGFGGGGGDTGGVPIPGDEFDPSMIYG